MIHASERLETQNRRWGFFGTIERAGHEPEAAWRLASTLIARSTGADDPNTYGPEGVRDWLDSRDGRHFADRVAGNLKVAPSSCVSLEQTIMAAIETYQGWKTDRAMTRILGIPAGQPYLSALVQYYAIEAEC
jgi:hypothetical protein